MVVAGNAFTISCGSSSSTKTFSGWGGGPFNTAILDSGQTGTLTVGVSRNSGGSGNALLIKSEITISIDYEYNFTPCSAPSNVWVDSSSVYVSGTTNLNWDGASAGKNMSISKYQIYRATTASGEYSHLADATLNPAADTTYYFMVITNGTIAGYNSGASAKVSVLVKTYTKCGNIPSTSFPSNIAEIEPCRPGPVIASVFYSPIVDFQRLWKYAVYRRNFCNGRGNGRFIRTDTV